MARLLLYGLCASLCSGLALGCGGLTEPTATAVTYAAGEITVQRAQGADTRPLVLYISERSSGSSMVAFECHLFATGRVTPCHLATTLRIGIEYAVAVFIDDQQSPRESAVGTVMIRGAAVSRQGVQCPIRNTSPCVPVALFTIIDAAGAIR